MTSARRYFGISETGCQTCSGASYRARVGANHILAQRHSLPIALSCRSGPPRLFADEDKDEDDRSDGSEGKDTNRQLAIA